MLSGKTQMATISWTVAAITLAALAYIVLTPPAYLLKSRYGVPHLTPSVADPAGGAGIPVDTLVRSYLGDEGGRKIYY